ncbi:MAG TPA: hypothetical protein VGX03_31770 [Candidatus Binatia bacterium]|nr:hypothetical protein [Candidatus Binatia bacterium]
MTHYVYVGVPQWAATESAELLGGLFRQEVGANEWQHLSTGLPDKAEVRALAIHPHNPHVIYAGTQHGPYHSLDCGDHWECLAFPDPGMVVWSISFHPHNPQTLYLGTAPAAVYRSDDGGERWRRLPVVETAGMVRMAFPTRVIRLALDPSRPEEIYAGLEVGGVIRSRDGGDTWSDCSSALVRLADQAHLKSQLGSDTEVEGMMDAHAVAVSAARPGTVFSQTAWGCSVARIAERAGRRWRSGAFRPLPMPAIFRSRPMILTLCMWRSARRRSVRRGPSIAVRTSARPGSVSIARSGRAAL